MTKKNKLSEGLSELAGSADWDHEVQMARADLYHLADNAIKLHALLKGISEEKGLEGWQQAKITKAAEYIDSVYKSLSYDQMTTATVMPENRKPKAAMSESEELEYKALLEKAKSKAQQKFMGMVYAAKKGEEPASPEVAKVAKGMSKKAAHDYAATKHKGKPEHVKEAPGFGKDDDERMTGGRRAVSPLQAKAWSDDAADKNAQAIERMPEFFNADHLRRVKKAAAFIDKTLGGKAVYINHRVRDQVTKQPVTAIKVTYPSWPKQMAMSSSVKEREFYEPLRELGMIRKDNIKNKAGNNEPGMIFYFQ
jgi:hypothetical protein